MATPAIITNVYSVTKSAKNGKFYLSAGATVAGQETILGQTDEQFRLVDIPFNSINDTIKALLEQEPTTLENGNLRYMAKDKTLKLDLAVTFSSMTQKDNSEAFWANL